MKFTISGIDVSKIIAPPYIEQKPRSQSVRTTLSGKTAIDRIGNLKYTINVSIPYISGTQWSALITILSEIIFPVSFTHNGATKNRDFWLDGSIPSPMVLEIGGIFYYQDVSFKLEEI